MNPNKGGRKYTTKGKKDKDVYLQAITMIDPAIGWIEMRSVPEARANLVANQVELSWLTRYLVPNKITVDRGKEFCPLLKIGQCKTCCFYTLLDVCHCGCVWGQLGCLL